MKKVNFNNLDNIQIPEAWTKNALSLPHTLENKKNVVFFGKFSKNLALVASLVLVCALSVSLFIFTQKGDILNTQKPSQNSESTTFTQTEPTEETVDDTKKPTTPSTTKPTTSGDKETTSTENSDFLKPAGGSSNKPNGGQTPTQKPAGPSGTPNSGTPGDSQTPTQKPTTTEPPEEPPNGAEFEFDGKITVEFPKSYLSGNGNVYCQIYDAYGTPLGDSDPYSDTHRALLKLSSTGNSSSSYVTATYNIDKGGFALSKGTYRYCFYNEDGEPICNGLFDVY